MMRAFVSSCNNNAFLVLGEGGGGDVRATSEQASSRERRYGGDGRSGRELGRTAGVAGGEQCTDVCRA